MRGRGVTQVARFFRTFHADNFMLYNCTAECVYPDTLFGGRVRRYAIEDHNVPQVETIVAFCRELEELAITQPGIVFAIHCRGGKGRTGTMVCAWLLCDAAQLTTQQCTRFSHCAFSGRSSH
jgi:PTEN phosphatase family protein